MLIISTLFWKNNALLNKEVISGELIDYSEKLNDRVNVLTNWKKGDCYVTQLKGLNTFQVYDLSDDPENWKNQCYKRFYNSGKVIPVKEN